MSVQRSVQRQKAATLAGIRDAATEFRSGARRLAWLRGLLESRGMDPDRGILVSVCETTEQQGQYFRGTWLTATRQFWTFEATVARDYRAILEVEAFDDRTTETAISAHIPGTGQSFGYLALEALGRGTEG